MDAWRPGDVRTFLALLSDHRREFLALLSDLRRELAGIKLELQKLNMGVNNGKEDTRSH